MDLNVTGPLDEALSVALRDHAPGPVRVTLRSSTTAGARRRNVVFDAMAPAWSGPRRLVATIVPPGETMVNPIAVEAEMIRLAAGHGVATASVEAVIDDPALLGGPALLTSFVEGETLPRRVLRLAEGGGHGDLIVRQLGTSLARLHAIDPAAAPRGLRSRPDGQHPARHALGLLRAEIDRLRLHRPAIELGFSWLERHLPDPPARDGIVHSDVRNGNIVVGPTGLRAILDWEAALNRSDPMQDLAWSALRMWRFRSDALEIGGLAGREPLTAGYSEAGGVFDVDRFEWWKVAETLRWALGLAQQGESFLSGRVPNLVMAASGRRVSELEWDLLMQIGTPLTGPRRSRLSPPAHLSASVVP